MSERIAVNETDHFIIRLDETGLWNVSLAKNGGKEGLVVGSGNDRAATFDEAIEKLKMNYDVA